MIKTFKVGDAVEHVGIIEDSGVIRGVDNDGPEPMYFVDWLIWMAGWSSADELRLQYAGPAVPDSTKDRQGGTSQGKPNEGGAVNGTLSADTKREDVEDSIANRCAVDGCKSRAVYTVHLSVDHPTIPGVDVLMCKRHGDIAHPGPATEWTGLAQGPEPRTFDSA